ncbi:DnaJ domain-containing protein [Pseudanabaena sp. FACHB-1998]|uniref:J domain-containing protein n=1 Tax=Pseudanabaena sp. FACHB-1998 TaxID=2692858 RepID=UPI0016817325|nr:DnaJ domain-containing protein [Pseudanabaena sp. FACHB-1998]MBD2175514.1 DnaJ domain-containing protein [Pseudanabaena sp. FACHB-1998]
MNQPPSEQKLQYIRIDRGISQFNNDYYAALGLPIITSPNYIRYVYLSIVRILHPDVYGFSPEQKEMATQYLAKLVNPAYNVLMKDQERHTYQAIFKLLAKRLMQKSRNIPIYSAAACELLMNPNDGTYERSVSAIAKLQYSSLDNILEYTAQISELNLVYILCKEGYNYASDTISPVLDPKIKVSSNRTNYNLNQNIVIPQPSVTRANTTSYPTTPKTSHNYQNYQNPQPNTYQPSQSRQSSSKPDADETVIQSKIDVGNVSGVSDRLRVCEIYMSQGDWKSALKELRDILLIDKDNSKAHAMLGVVYKNINQPQMAKVSLKRSLQLNPQEPLALKHIQDLNNSSSSQPISTTKIQKSSAQTKKVDAKENTEKSAKKANIPEPEKRGWLSNLLGWVSPNDPKN